VILVTGATGLIGSHLLAELVGQGHPCRAIKRQDSDLETVRKVFKRKFKSDKEFEMVEWLEADLLDIEALRRAVSGSQYVFHCAAMVSFFSNDSEIMKKTNIQGTRYLVNLALEEMVQKFIFVSSSAAIGNQPDSEVVSESGKWIKDAGNSNYGLSKYLAELEVWRASEEGLDMAIINPCIVIGPGNWESSSPVLFTRINKGLKFYTPGSNAFVDVRDVVSIMLKLCFGEIKNERYLLCSENLSYKSLFDMIAPSLDQAAPDFEVKRWMANLAMIFENIKSFFAGRKPFITRETVQNGFRDIRYSNEKAKKELNFEFIPIRESVQFTADAFLEDRKH